MMKNIKLFIVTISSEAGEHSRIVRDELEAKRMAFKHRSVSIKAAIRPVVLTGETLEAVKPIKLTREDARRFRSEQLEQEVLALV